MQELSNQTAAETSSEGASASLTVDVSTSISTPVHHGEASSILADSTASSISSSTSLPTSSIVSSVSVQNSPYFAIPGPSEPQAGPSSDILQTALLISGMGQDFLSDIVQTSQDLRREVPPHKLSLLQDDLYLSDSDDETLEYELDLNTDISYDLIDITGSESVNDDSVSDSDDDSPDDDGSVSESDSFSSDSSDCSSDEGDETDASTDDGNSSDDEAESSSDSDDELDEDDCEQRVRRRPLLRASDILTANTSCSHNFVSLTLREEIVVSGKRKRDDDGPGFSPKRIKLEEEMRAKRKGEHEEETECGLSYKRRKLEAASKTSSGSNHKRKRRSLCHKDAYKYPPSIPKIQRLVSKVDQLFPNPCPKTCPCIAGCRVSSLRLRRIRRRYTVIRPLYRKLLNSRLLGPDNLSRHRCCEKLCCFRWFGKALPQYALLDDYPQSNFGTQDFRIGTGKDGKRHLI